MLYCMWYMRLYLVVQAQHYVKWEELSASHLSWDIEI